MKKQPRVLAQQVVQSGLPEIFLLQMFLGGKAGF